MQTFRFFTILTFVTLAAAATVALAWGLNWMGAPLWQVLAGPLLLLAMVVLKIVERHFQKARRAAETE